MALTLPRPRRRRFAAFALALACAGIAGCVPEDVTPTEPILLDGTSFAIEPLPQSETVCDPNAPFPVRLRWEVLDWVDPEFDIRLRSSKGQLPAHVKTASGEIVLDPFNQEGLWILLVDRNSRMVVAAQRVPALACPAAG